MQPLYLFILSFVGGVALFSVATFPLFLIIFFFVAGVLFFVFYANTSVRTFLFLSIIFSAFAISGLRVFIDDNKPQDVLIEKRIGAFVSLEGVVIREPDEREKSTMLVVGVDGIDGIERKQETKILVTTSRYPKYHYGDRILLEGKLLKPKNFTNERGKEFDYIAYLAKDDVYYSLFFPEITYVESGEGNPIKETLFTIKQSWLSSIERLLPEPHVSLLGGLVVGEKQSLGDELEDNFRKTGIIHIVVLSGYNVTIVAEAIMRFFSFLPRALGMSLGAFSIVLFAIMTGASATIVRASIMALLVVLARATGRTNDITRALFLAGFFMVFHNPKIVLYDPSFQLSFLATLGLIYLAPQLERYFQFVPTKWQLREFATATIATQVFVLPLLLYMMGEISLVALPVNLLILGLIPLTMLFGFLAGVFGFVSSILSFPFSVVSYFLLSYELSVVDIFSNIPFASISITDFPLWLMFLLYFLYGGVLYRLRKE